MDTQREGTKGSTYPVEQVVEQDVAPSALNKSGGQGMQSLVAPTVGFDFPAGQSLQVALDVAPNVNEYLPGAQDPLQDELVRPVEDP